MQTQSLANLAWSNACLEFGDIPWRTSISSTSGLRIAQFRAPERVAFAWAMSVCLFPTQPLFKAISAAARPRIALMERDRIANTAWAYASCLYSDQPMLKAIAAAALRTRMEYRLKESGSLARALWVLLNDS